MLAARIVRLRNINSEWSDCGASFRGLLVSDARRRVRARVEGTVQGVGFRPYVHRLASELGLAGFVLNDARGVLLEVEADGAAVTAFLERLPAEGPPLASVERVLAQELAPTGGRGFAIAASEGGDDASAPVVPDAATCAACLAEVRDPADRRHGYPFTNCTDCGPRFTIVLAVPYDRARTTMASFTMCARCRAEYEDPADRRFHAEPNACPDCGPIAWLADPGPAAAARPADPPPGAVTRAGAELAAGAVLAVKGLGGFHLVCRADAEPAVARLRARKRREEKPFALMAADLAGARALVALAPAEEALLAGRERPIVLARRRSDARVAPSVAPRSADLGVMLPYTPLHHLLLAAAGGPLVMTSGNLSDEPIAHRDADAAARLGPLVDRILMHDRPIQTRADDSVVRAVAGRPPLVMRRARGFAPAAIALPCPAPAAGDVLACGAELKSTVCLARGGRAWVSQHIGDLTDWATLEAYREAIAHLERLFSVRPSLVAHDLHPDYLSTRYALEREGVRALAVQHHHAHLAAVLAEHGAPGPAIGAIFDGAGYGPDGTVWGGELLYGDLEAYTRVGGLPAVRLPGGDAAAREPWRMAAAWLVAATGESEPEPPATIAAAVAPERWRAICRMADTGTAAPITTSAGRLFDAIAAICGLRTHASYEGQAAGELEAVCDPAERGAYEMPGLDARPAVLAAAADAAVGRPAGVIAARFHAGLAAETGRAAVAAAEAHGTGLVVLAGGVFQNRRLLEATAAGLTAMGLQVLTPVRLPPNDGAIAYGQAAVAIATGNPSGPLI